MKGLSHWDGLNSNEKLEGFKSLLTASDIPLDGVLNRSRFKSIWPCR